MPRPAGPVATPPGARLQDVGEAGLLAAMLPLLARGTATLVGPGDDTAVLRAPDGRVVATTDVLVEGRDFRLDWSSGADVGAKAAAQNLADVAATGAVPTGLLVGLVAPGDLPVAWALDLARGLVEACEGTGAAVVGGDLSGGRDVVVAVTALGDLQGRAPVLRSGARPGEDVALAGVLGRSATGWRALEVLGAPEAGRRLPDLVAAHRRPVPPYAAGPAAAHAGATAMLDLSDGLLRDAGRLASASDVVLDLDEQALTAFVDPLRAAAAMLDADPWALVLGGGEDHGLLATFPAGTAPAGFTVVGRTSAPGPGEAGVLVGGRAQPAAGWDHFGG